MCLFYGWICEQARQSKQILGKPLHISNVRGIASIYAHMPLHTCTADMEKIYFLFSEKANLVIKSEWLIDFLNNIGVFVLVSPYRYLVVGTNEGALEWSSCSRPIFFDICVLYFCCYFISKCHHCVKNIIL